MEITVCTELSSIEFHFYYIYLNNISSNNKIFNISRDNLKNQIVCLAGLGINLNYTYLNYNISLKKFKQMEF